ncbi:MAG: helicase C-terminal domain-containing protein [Candidatus Bathyarchaeia archaeon]
MGEADKEVNVRLGLFFEGYFKLGFLEEVRPELAEGFRIELEEKLEGDGEIFDLIRLLGFWAGHFYGRGMGEVKLEKYHMGEESEDIVWRNADLLFLSGGELHVVDFKLANFFRVVKRMDSIPVSIPGVPVNISVGELDFISFLRNFLKQKGILKRQRHIFIEVKGLSQLLCYAADYLIDRYEGGIREVILELIYPVQEPLRIRFHVEEREIPTLMELREEVKEVYRKLKNKRVKVEEREGRGRAEAVEIRADPIDRAREDVREKVLSFMEREERCKVLALLHSAGSGKTMNIRGEILKRGGKHIVLYMASRLRLVEREEEEVRKLGGEDVAVVLAERGGRRGKWVKHTGQGFEELEGKEGKLKGVIDEVLRKWGERKYRQIWGFTTIQAVVEKDGGKSTSEHLRKFLNATILTQNTFHIILDEPLGYSNGLYAIMEMIKFLKEVRDKGGRANLYILDASGYSPTLLEKLLVEFEQYEAIPDSIVLCPFLSSLKFECMGIPVWAYARHGYPSGKVILRRKFFEGLGRDKKAWVEPLGDYIGSTIDGESTGFVFLQDKELIVYLASFFKERGLKFLIATASHKKGQEEINRGDHDLILGTSSISRGLDFSRPHKPVKNIYVVVSHWGIEQNLVEILQAISRARGDRRTEGEEKILHLIYIINDEEGLSQWVELDEVIERIVERFLKTPSEGENVLVPVPVQYRTVYRPNPVKELEELLTFLDDVFLSEPEEEKLRKFIRLLYSSISLSTSDLDLDRAIYYHPYLLMEGNLKVSFDGRRWKRLVELFEEIKGVLLRYNSEKALEVEEFVKKGMLPVQISRTTFLLPIYSFVFTQFLLKEGQQVVFSLKKRVGRGKASVLGGNIGIKTRCFAGSCPEYAIIPLGEDYPYREVLSGRFARFPIEFVRGLLEGGNGTSDSGDGMA